MRKHKIDFKKYADMHDEVEVTGKDGTKVKVRTHIPYEDKLKIAQEIIEQGLMIHDDSICYEGHLMQAIKMKKVLEYYTDVKTDDVEPEVVADFLINNEIWDEIDNVIYKDWFSVQDIFFPMMSGVIDTYQDDRGLTKAIRTSFGFLFNGEDITESLAKAEATKDTLYKAIGALNEKEKEEQEKINNGKLMIGNNILNFSKRE